MIHNPQQRVHHPAGSGAIAALAGVLVLLAAGCEKGPAEKAGHRIDEKVDTLKHGGHESIGNQAEDKADEARDKARDKMNDATK
jgi:hypothetical protein